MHLHHLPALAAQLGIDPALLMSAKGPHIAASLAVLAAPGLTAWGADRVWRWGDSLGAYLADVAAAARGELATADGGSAADAGAGVGAAAVPALGGFTLPPWRGVEDTSGLRDFVTLSYGFLPLVWVATLASYFDALLQEAGRILPVRPAPGLQQAGACLGARRLQGLPLAAGRKHGHTVPWRTSPRVCRRSRRPRLASRPSGCPR